MSESTVYRLLKAHDLITSPAFIVIKAADAFQAAQLVEHFLQCRDELRTVAGAFGDGHRRARGCADGRASRAD